MFHMRHGLPLAIVLAAALLAAAAEEDGQTFTDPAKAGADFAVQGEYAGTIAEGGKEIKAGAQVVALGKGKFDLMLYYGGLPGAGWKRTDKKKQLSGETKDQVTSFASPDLAATIQEGKLALKDSGGTPIGKLTKIERKSPTLGAKPPDGAIVLFDGKSAENFINGNLVDGLLQAGCETKQKFQDHTIHLEFRTPFKPHARGQERGNSGVYPQGRYEIQVLDSFGLEGLNNECGGIYSIRQPDVNMCFPPLSWQTYDIEVKSAKYDAAGKKVQNARITVKHNGVVIHDNVELDKGTPGKLPEGPEPGPLYLQGHGNPVFFRNIWVVANSN
jgi:hypothetical protein